MICWGKYPHFSKSQICHPTYPMSPPITFRPWMDKLCENKFLGANSASPALLTSSKVPPEASQKGAKVWRGRHMRRPFERHLWICLWGAGASQDGRCLHQKKKIHAQREGGPWPPFLQPALPFILIDDVFLGRMDLEWQYVKFSIPSP